MALIFVFSLFNAPNVKAIGDCLGYLGGLIWDKVSFKNKLSALIKYKPLSAASIFKLAIVPPLRFALADFDRALFGSK